jgi:hypothetical protein
MVTAIYDCVGCGTDAVDPFGPDQVLVGLAVVAFAMVPLAILHLARRRRGRSAASASASDFNTGDILDRCPCHGW